MAGIGMKDLLNLMKEELKPSDVDNLKYILEESFTGKFHQRFSSLALKSRGYLNLPHDEKVFWFTSSDIFTSRPTRRICRKIFNFFNSISPVLTLWLKEDVTGIHD